MRLIFSDVAWEDYLYWQQHDRRILDRINKLIREIQSTVFRYRETRAIEACTFRLLVTSHH